MIDSDWLDITISKLDLLCCLEICGGTLQRVPNLCPTLSHVTGLISLIAGHMQSQTVFRSTVLCMSQLREDSLRLKLKIVDLMSLFGAVSCLSMLTFLEVSLETNLAFQSSA